MELSIVIHFSVTIDSRVSVHQRATHVTTAAAPELLCSSLFSCSRPQQVGDGHSEHCHNHASSVYFPLPSLLSLTLSVPLAITAPAIAATVAYLNARSSAWYDLLLLRCALTGAGRMYYREYVDRLNLFYALEAVATSSSTADRALLIFEGARYTYAEAYDRILRYGRWLRSDLGVKPKDVVAIDYQNSDHFVFLWWGLWSIGAKPAFINYNLVGASLVHCLNAATTRLCIVDPSVAVNVTPDVRDQLPDIRFVILTPDVKTQILAHEPVRAPDSDRSESSLSNMSILIYTSGTTGMPKPAIVSWGKLIVGGTVAEKLQARGDGDVMYTVGSQAD